MQTNISQDPLSKGFKLFLSLSIAGVLIDAAVLLAAPFLRAASPSVQTAVHLLKFLPGIALLFLLCIEMRHFHLVPLLMALTGNGFTAIVTNRLICTDEDRTPGSQQMSPLCNALGLLLVINSLVPFINQLSPELIDSSYHTGLKLGTLAIALGVAWKELKCLPLCGSLLIVLAAPTHPNLSMMLLLFFRHQHLDGESQFKGQQFNLFLTPVAFVSVVFFALWVSNNIFNTFSLTLNILTTILYLLLCIYCCIGLAIRFHSQRFENRRLLVVAALLQPSTALWAWPYCLPAAEQQANSDSHPSETPVPSPENTSEKQCFPNE